MGWERDIGELASRLEGILVAAENHVYCWECGGSGYVRGDDRWERCPCFTALKRLVDELRPFSADGSFAALVEELAKKRA